MTLRKATYFVAVLGYLLLGVIGCTKPAPPPPPGDDHHHLLAVQPVTLALNAGNCQQFLNGVNTPFVTISAGDTVTWTASNAFGGGAQAFTLRVAGSPMPGDFGSGGAAVTSGTVSGTSGATYPYVSVTIGGQPCNNPGQLGFIMH